VFREDTCRGVASLFAKVNGQLKRYTRELLTSGTGIT